MQRVLAVALVVFAAQAAADLIAVLRFGAHHSLVDLDRNNAIPDVLSTLVVLAAACGAAALAVTRRDGRHVAAALAIVLAIVALDDLLQAEPGPGWGLTVAAALVAAGVLIAAIARHAPRSVAGALLAGLCLLALAVKEGYWYDQFLNQIGLGDHRRGDVAYELGIVLKQGLEFLGWSLVALGVWATPKGAAA